MNKVYVVAPLAGLLLFGGYYWKHARLHALRVAETERAALEEKDRKRAQQDAEHAQAMAQAKVIVAKRTAEKAEKERRENDQKQARQDLEQRRNAAADTTRKLRPQLDRLRVEIESVESTLVRLDERKRELEEERTFLAGHVRQTEADQQSYYRLLEKAEAAERARPKTLAPPAAPGKS